MKYLRVLLGAFLGAVITFAAPLAHAEFLEYKAKAESGDAAAQCNLARCYLNGEGVGKDGEQAEKWFRKAAEQGLADGQNGLGVCYRSGKGVAKDEVEAVKWFRRAADQGFAKAEFNLGVCYAFGQGVSQNAVGAVKWFRKAADQGFAEGQNSLAVCYFKGEGVDKDVVEAVKWFRKSAEQGNPNGQLKLGSCYAFGQGVDENEVEAVKWFRKAAEQGVAIAQYNLGNCYNEGHGVAKDKVEAVKWYKKAAEQGQSDGQLNLAIAYYSGEGVDKDGEQAEKWFRKAADQGQRKAKIALDEIEIEKEKLENGGVRQKKMANYRAQEKAHAEALTKQQIETPENEILSKKIKAFKTFNFGEVYGDQIQKDELENKLIEITGASIADGGGRPGYKAVGNRSAYDIFCAEHALGHTKLFEPGFRISELYIATLFDSQEIYESEMVKYGNRETFRRDFDMDEIQIDSASYNISAIPETKAIIASDNEKIDVECLFLMPINKKNVTPQLLLSGVKVFYLDPKLDYDKLISDFTNAFHNSKIESRKYQIENEKYPGFYLNFETLYVSYTNEDVRARLTIPLGKFDFVATDAKELTKAQLDLWAEHHKVTSKGEVQAQINNAKEKYFQYSEMVKNAHDLTSINNNDLYLLGFPNKKFINCPYYVQGRPSVVFTCKKIVDPYLERFQKKRAEAKNAADKKAKQAEQSASGF